MYRIQFEEENQYRRFVTHQRGDFETFADANCAAHQVNRCAYVRNITIIELTDETYCTRCRQTNTDARSVYFPLSDEDIQLCTACEPNDTAASSFEVWG